MENTISIYVSPLASQVNTHEIEQIFNRVFFRRKFEIKAPKNLDLLSDEIQKEISSDSKIIVCAGGDGTINRILNEVHPHPATLFILPSGTANDLANELGIQPHPLLLQKIVQYKTVKEVDVIDVNEKGFLTHGGLGFAADLCEKMNQSRKESERFKHLMKTFKSDSYMIQSAAKLLTQRIKLYKLKLTSPHLPKNGLIVETPCLTISNQSHIAQKLPIAPYTKNNDKLFCVSLFLSKSNFDVIRKFIKLRAGKNLLNELSFNQFETHELRIENLSGEKISFYGDGDIITKDSKFNLKIREDSQKFFYFDNQFNYNTTYSLNKVSQL